MKERMFILSLLSLGLSGGALADPAYRVISTQTEHLGPLVRTVETIAAGANPIDRFKLYHVSRAELCGEEEDERRGALLLAPPLGTGFQFYETSDTTSYQDSFVAYYARRGFDVWGYSQRMQDLPAGACEGGSADCSVMAGWGLAQLRADAEYVRTRIAAADPSRLPVIGGMSLGGMVGLAAVDERPGSYAGVMVLDGGLYSNDASVRAIAEAGCQGLGAAVGAGLTYDAQGVQGLKLLTKLAQSAPDAPSQIPGFPPGLTNQQVWLLVLGVPNPGPASPSPSFIFAASDYLNGALSFSDAAFLQRGMLSFVDYNALATIRDVDCGLAGARTFTSHLAAFRGPAFLVQNGRGLGGIVSDTRALLSSARVTFSENPAFGHFDLFFGGEHQGRLLRPLLRWLRTQAFGAPRGDD